MDPLNNCQDNNCEMVALPLNDWSPWKANGGEGGVHWELLSLQTAEPLQLPRLSHDWQMEDAGQLEQLLRHWMEAWQWPLTWNTNGCTCLTSDPSDRHNQPITVRGATLCSVFFFKWLKSHHTNHKGKFMINEISGPLKALVLSYFNWFDFCTLMAIVFKLK